MITQGIANFWLCRFTRDETKMIPPFLRNRLIENFLGDHDRRLNRLQSHLHATIDYLMQYTSSNATNTDLRHHWTREVQQSLDRSKFCQDDGHPLQATGYSEDPYSTILGDIRPEYIRKGNAFTENSPPDPRATGFVIAIIRENYDLQVKIMQSGHSPSAKCPFFGDPLRVACRLGMVATV